MPSKPHDTDTHTHTQTCRGRFSRDVVWKGKGKGLFFIYFLLSLCVSFAIFLLSSLSSSVLSALLLFSPVPHHPFTQSSFLASFLLHLHSVFTISASFLSFIIHSLHPFLTASTHFYLHLSSNFKSSSFCSHHLICISIFLSSFILFNAPPNIVSAVVLSPNTF